MRYNIAKTGTEDVLYKDVEKPNEIGSNEIAFRKCHLAKMMNRGGQGVKGLGRSWFREVTGIAHGLALFVNIGYEGKNALVVICHVLHLGWSRKRLQNDNAVGGKQEG